jgi:hypothetical protein
LVADAYCPGNYDLAVSGRKIAGMSQRWFRNPCGVHCIVAAASINVEEQPDVFAGVVNQFYSRAGSPRCCRATDLTNMRLCVDFRKAARQDLVISLMDQLAVAHELLP